MLGLVEHLHSIDPPSSHDTQCGGGGVLLYTFPFTTASTPSAPCAVALRVQCLTTNSTRRRPGTPDSYDSWEVGHGIAECLDGFGLLV